MFLFKDKQSATPKSGERLSRSFAKAASWRILGSLDTLALSYFFTRDAAAATGIAATEVITKIGLYTIHERLWARVKWGSQAAQVKTETVPQQTQPQGPGEKRELTPGA